jgi:ferric-dicitrate binding protein FerR (iron transport regulator)
MQAPRHFGRRAFLGGAIAASAAFLLIRGTVPGGFSGLGADYITAVGEQRRLDLADGVSLELNTQTRLNHRQSADGGQGLELLSGEVEVLAQADTPLKVQAGGGWLSASRARFNVRNINQSVCVTCLEGALQLETLGRSIRLETGQQVTYDTRQISTPQSVDTTAVIAWRQQILVFNDATLASVIDEINRYRPGMLLLLNSELGKRKVQARFSLDQLAGVALLIRDAYGVKCTELPGGVVVLS